MVIAKCRTVVQGRTGKIFLTGKPEKFRGPKSLHFQGRPQEILRGGGGGARGKRTRILHDILCPGPSLENFHRGGGVLQNQWFADKMGGKGLEPLHEKV